MSQSWEKSLNICTYVGTYVQKELNLYDSSAGTQNENKYVIYRTKEILINNY